MPNFHSIRNVEIILKTSKGAIVVYISAKIPNGLIYKLQHRLRVLSALHGCFVCVYDKDMDFSNALEAGGEIVFKKNEIKSIKQKL